MQNRLVEQDDSQSADVEQPSYRLPRRHSRKYLAKRRRQRLLKHFGLVLVPFVIFLIGLSLISVGIVQYIEQDSLLSMFLTSRDSAKLASMHNVGWEQVTESTEELTGQTAVENQDGRLVVPFYYVGDCFGQISIPSVSIDVNVYQGDSEAQFRKGAGHYAGSFFPGQNGNIVLAAHRTSYFRNFEYLKVGDRVDFTTTYGEFAYQVRAFKIIDGQDNSIGDATSAEQLTMYTCYPFVYIGNAPQRFVVVCDRIDPQVQP